MPILNTNADLSQQLLPIIDNEEAFNAIDWSQFTSSEQRVLLKKAENIAFGELRIINCSQLTMPRLTRILRKSYNLTRLEISDNKHIDNSLGELIVKFNPGLKQLYLQRLPRLSRIFTLPLQNVSHPRENQAQNLKKKSPYEKLEVLQVEECNLDSEAGLKIAKHLQYLPELFKLNLKNNHIKDRCIEEILQQKINCPHNKFQGMIRRGLLFFLQYKELRHKKVYDIQLSGNPVRRSYLQRLINELSKPTLDIDLSNIYTRSVAKSICEKKGIYDKIHFMQTHNKRLRQWRIHHQQVKGTEFFIQNLIVGSVGLIVNVESLNLAHCGFSIESISECLENCQMVKSLNISNNRIGDELKFGYFDGIFQALCFLQALDCSNNDLSSASARIIAQSLNYSDQLQSLNFSKNLINDAGAEFIAQQFHTWPLLRSIDLSNNKIGDAGAKAILQHIEDCPQLEELRLAHNRVSADIMKQIDDALEENKQRYLANVQNTPELKSTIQLLSEKEQANAVSAPVRTAPHATIFTERKASSADSSTTPAVVTNLQNGSVGVVKNENSISTSTTTTSQNILSDATTSQNNTTWVSARPRLCSR